MCGYELHKLDTTLYCGYQQKKVLPQKRSSAQCKHKHMSNAFGVLQYRNLPHVLTALRTVHNAPRSIRVKFDICVFRRRQRELRGTGAVVWIIFFIASCVVVFLRLCFCGSAAVLLPVVGVLVPFSELPFDSCVAPQNRNSKLSRALGTHWNTRLL